MAGGEMHAYQVQLEAGKFLQIAVEQKGIDVVVTFFDADGKQLVETDSPNGTQGPKTVLAIATKAGAYKVEVRSLEKQVPSGHYEIKIAELREATTEDHKRIASDS
jgi:phosphoribosyl-dephospho-CoA transferase